jgi:hypothetical protein
MSNTKGKTRVERLTLAPVPSQKDGRSAWRRCSGPDPVKVGRGAFVGPPCPWGVCGKPALTRGKQCPRCARGFDVVGVA